MTEDNYTLDEVRTVTKILKEFPFKIKELEEKISVVSIIKEELIAKKKTMESEIALEVYNEKIKIPVEIKPDKRSMTKEEKEKYIPIFQDVFKDRFTNELQRESEERKRLANSKDYNEYQDTIDKSSKDINSKMIQLSYMKRLNSNAGYLAVLGVLK